MKPLFHLQHIVKCIRREPEIDTINSIPHENNQTNNKKDTNLVENYDSGRKPINKCIVIRIFW